MITRIIFHALISIMFMKIASASIEFHSVNRIIASPKYFSKFEISAVDPKTENFTTRVTLHVIKDFPVETQYTTYFYKDFHSVRKEDLGFYHSMICAPDENYKVTPQFLQDLTKDGTCIKAMTEEMTFEKAGYFKIEGLIPPDYVGQEFLLENINTIMVEKEIVLQYKIRAMHYISEYEDTDSE